MRRINRVLAQSVASLAIVAAQLPARAVVLPEDVDEKRVLGLEARQHLGWFEGLTLGGTASYNHSRSVVGAVDGATVQLGLILSGNLGYATRTHDFETTLKLQESQTRTPQLEGFIKSIDVLQIISVYSYSLPAVPWLGPYLRISFDTQALPGYDVRAETQTIVRRRSDGTVVTKNKAPQERIFLTSAFEPIVLRESAGFFAAPVDKKRLRLKAKAGAGVQHVFSRGGFALSDDDDTPALEYQQIEGSSELGTEVEITASGELRDGVSWDTKANLFYPVLTSSQDRGTGWDVLNADLSAKLSVKLVAWASLDYVFTAKRIPAVLDKWQIQSGVMVTSSVDLM